MKMSQLEKSNYYRGLLVLVGKDRMIDQTERDLMIQVGRTLDFDPRFCESAIDDLLRNRYLTDEPIIFSVRHAAECFLRDAIRVAIVDSALHPQELKWLRVIARSNGLPQKWLNAEIAHLQELKASNSLPDSFEIQRYLEPGQNDSRELAAQ
jgi:hypothetical protein